VPHVSIERELGNHQHASFSLAHGAVHLAGGILENSQAGDFAGQVVRVGFGVVL
jgi:hypothetical protein